MDAATLYGIPAQAPSYGTAAPTQGIAVTGSVSGLRSLIDPQNPLLWFIGLVAVTMGAAGVAGSVRLGKAKFSASAGG